jgi:hypothetical protein
MHAKSREKVGGVAGVQCSTRSERAHFFFPMWRPLPTQSAIMVNDSFFDLPFWR